MMLPLRSRAGKKRTWWPWSSGLVATGLFFVSSLHSPSIQNWNAAVGLDVLVPGLNDAWATPPVSECGSSDCESTFACVKSAPAMLLFFVYQRMVAVFPCVWYAASWRTEIGVFASARTQ